MLFFSPEISRWILIHGVVLDRCSTRHFYTDLTRNVRDTVTVQAFRVDSVAGPRHVYAAVMGALRAFEQKKNVAKNLGLEILVHASGHRQIKKALELLGVEDGSKELVLVVVASKRKDTEETIARLGEIIPFIIEDTLIEKMTQERKAWLMRVFGISREEYRSALALSDEPSLVLEKLVVEKVALLATEL